MYTQSYEDAGRDSSASTAENNSSTNHSTWRQLPPEATAAVPTAPPVYEENLQNVLEDSERHLDALWNMLNSQMTRLSSGYMPTTEAQSLSMPPAAEHPVSSIGQIETQAASESAAIPSENVNAPEAIADHAEIEPVAVGLSAMPFNFVPTVVPALVMETEPEESVAEEAQSSVVEASISETAKEEGTEGTEEISAEYTDPIETVAYASLMQEADFEPIPMPLAYRSSADASETDAGSDVSAAYLAPETLEPEAVPMPSSVTALASAAEHTPVDVSEPAKMSEAVEVPQEAPHPSSVPFPAVRVESAFRDNWMVVTAREAGSVTVLPTVTLRMQSQPNQSLKMRSTAIGEMPTEATPLIVLESREEAGSDPAAMRIEIAYTPDAPDMVFEVNSQSEDEVQITLSDQSGDLCASWEVSKQKGKYARAKAILSRQANDPAVLIEIQRFREDADPDVWHSLLSFSVVPK